jgi:hypothetical protein
MTAAVLGGSVAWQAQSMTFLATTTTQTLSFSGGATLVGANSRVDVGIDTIEISQIPEPGVATLLGMGLAMMSGMRRSDRR